MSSITRYRGQTVVIHVVARTMSVTIGLQGRLDRMQQENRFVLGNWNHNGYSGRRHQDLPDSQKYNTTALAADLLVG